MKRYLYLFLITAAFNLAACSSADNNMSRRDTTTVDTSIISAGKQSCYTYIKDKDTVTMTMMSSGEITTGQLNYSLYGKDKNKGIFEGELHGDTLIAEYTFNSEGKESVRQVAFLQKGAQLLEGYGEVLEQNGKTMFKSTSSLKFGEGIVFSKTDCY